MSIWYLVQSAQTSREILVPFSGSASWYLPKHHMCSSAEAVHNKIDKRTRIPRSFNAARISRRSSGVYRSLPIQYACRVER